MKCPECKHTKSAVVDSRTRQNAIIRRRKCADCGHRFNTKESEFVKRKVRPLIVKPVLEVQPMVQVKNKPAKREPRFDELSAEYIDSLSDEELEVYINGEGYYEED